MKLKYTINLNFILTMGVFLGLLFFFSYKIVNSFNYDSDFGRDLYDMLDIIQGKWRLLGPRLSFGGFISGPYYYYLFAIPLWFGHGNPEYLLYFSALLHAMSLALLFYFLLQTSGKIVAVA